MHSFAKSSKVTYMTRFSIHSNCVLHLWDLAARVTLISVFLPRTAFFLERLLNLPAHLHAGGHRRSPRSLRMPGPRQLGRLSTADEMVAISLSRTSANIPIRCTLNSCSVSQPSGADTPALPGNPPGPSPTGCIN